MNKLSLVSLLLSVSCLGVLAVSGYGGLSVGVCVFVTAVGALLTIMHVDAKALQLMRENKRLHARLEQLLANGEIVERQNAALSAGLLSMTHPERVRGGTMFSDPFERLLHFLSDDVRNVQMARQLISEDRYLLDRTEVLKALRDPAFSAIVLDSENLEHLMRDFYGHQLVEFVMRAQGHPDHGIIRAKLDVENIPPLNPQN